jgi:hypothetical protein
MPGGDEAWSEIGAPNTRDGQRAADLAAMIGELVMKSPDFGRLWDRYEVQRMGDGERCSGTRRSAP